LTNAVVRHLRRLAFLQDGGEWTDGQLLERFLMHLDADAFAALVARHGPMVLSVCRRVLRNEHDAEDAFQATFLVLARKAASLSVPTLLGGWLHGVAYRTSLKARTALVRRRAHEQGARLPEVAHEYDPEMLDLLDEELGRLPDKFRIPLLLCELEGRTRKQVAAQMRVPEGTVSSRLATAKKLLAKRLARRGIVGAAGATAVLAHGTASANIPRTLAQATAKAAVQIASGHGLMAGIVSAQALTLTEGVMKAMFLGKLKTAGWMILAVVIGMGAIGSSYGPVTASDGQRDAAATVRGSNDELDELRLEIAALRKGLQVARDQIKSMQDEMQWLKAEQARASSIETHVAQSPAKQTERGKALHDATKVFHVHDLVVPSQQLNFDSTAVQLHLEPYKAVVKLKEAQALLAREAASRNQTIAKLIQASPATERTKPQTQPASIDALADAELALKKLRENGNDQEASDALERALEIWRRQKTKAQQPTKP
jgi:RNA polymerase sigma factor (sigma-70 family)